MLSHRIGPRRPSRTSGLEKTRASAPRSKSSPSCWRTPLTKTSNGTVTSAGSSTLVRAVTPRRMPAPVRRLATLVAVAVGALALAAPAIADNAGLTPVEPRSPNAEAINDTYYLLLAVTGVVFVLVEGALVAFAVKYRRRR